MVRIVSFTFLIFAIFSCVLTEEKIETYPDKYDYIDVDAILANERLSEGYYNCFMDLGPCVTPDQKFFREFIPEVFRTHCRKCTDKQNKIMFDKMSENYSKNLPAKWEAIIKKYVVDPAGLNPDKKN